MQLGWYTYVLEAHNSQQQKSMYMCYELCTSDIISTLMVPFDRVWVLEKLATTPLALKS